MTALILGATGGVGQALARALAGKGTELLLIGRDQQKLKYDADHLRSAHGINVTIVVADAAQANDFATRVATACAQCGSIDAVFCPIGASHLDDDGTQPPVEINKILNINFTCVVSVIEIVLPGMRAADRGAIVGFSSVAAARGRRANVVYSGAKRALESYFESLRHKLVGTHIRATVYRLGYVETKQNYGKRLIFPQVTPEKVAQVVIARMHKREGLVVFPLFWWPITIIVKAIPWSLFKRMKF